MGSAKSPRGELDDLIVNTELTLISLIQGIALFFLAEYAVEAYRESSWQSIPYVLTGLLIVLAFWSRALIHTFTIIGWPLEFTHNFLYIGLTLLESMTFAETLHPRSWWTIYVLFVSGCWLLFLSDVRMIDARLAQSRGPASRRFLEEVRREQLLQCRLVMPLLVGSAAAGAAAVRRFPEAMEARGGHVVLASLLAAGYAVYLAAVCRYFAKLAPLLEEARQESA